jgi:hypothetical protein
MVFYLWAGQVEYITVCVPLDGTCPNAYVSKSITAGYERERVKGLFDTEFAALVLHLFFVLISAVTYALHIAC